MNAITLIGNLAEEPKIITTTGGKPKCTLRLCTNRSYINKQTGKRDADFHTVLVWGVTAEACAKYLHKGSKCAVRGSVQYRSFESINGGKRYITEIMADEVEFLGGKDGARDEAAHEGQRAPAAGQGEFAPADEGYTLADDEFPF